MAGEAWFPLLVLAWSALGFVSGAVPWAVWLGRVLAHADVRAYGDRNPGAANAWKAGGWRVGTAAVLLDMGKGTVPVLLATTLSGTGNPGLIPIGLAPIVGHAYSPMLRFRGGKASAVSVGVWAALTAGAALPVLAVSLAIGYAFQRTDGWTVILGGLGILGLLLARYPEPHLLLLWAANLGILALKLRDDLKLGVVPRPWLLRALGRTH